MCATTSEASISSVAIAFHFHPAQIEDQKNE